jgi:uncharacterized protein YwbE
VRKRHTVARNNKELIVICQLVHCHIGVGSHNLLLGGELGALLELKVTDGTGQSEVTVDTAEVDEATRGTNASLLACSEELAYHPHGMKCSLSSCSRTGCSSEKSSQGMRHKPSF